MRRVRTLAPALQRENPSGRVGNDRGKDKYGVSWQVVPGILNEMINDPDYAKSQRAMEAMLKMKKIDIDALKRAYAG